MRPVDQAEYIVQCIREAGSMYEDDAWAFLAEHDAHTRAQVLTTLSEDAERRLAAGTSRTVAKATVRRFLQLEASVARAAVTGEKSSPDFFQPGHRYALEIWRFHCATVTTHPDTGERQAIGWIRVSDGSWTAYAYSATEWGERWTDITNSTQGDSK